MSDVTTLAWLAIGIAVAVVAVEVVARRPRLDDLDWERSPPTLIHDGLPFVDRYTPTWMQGFGQVFGPEQLPAIGQIAGHPTLEQQLRDLICPLLTGSHARSSPAVLLWGARGVGRTLVSAVLAHEFQARFIHVSARFLTSMGGGTSQPRIAAIVRYAEDHTPSVLFIDDLELISGASDHPAIQASAHDLLNALRRRDRHARVAVIAALSTEDAFVPSAGLAGAFGPVLHVESPDAETRREILERLLATQELAVEEVDDVLAMTTGLTPAALIDLTRSACGRAQMEHGPIGVVQARHFAAVLEEIAAPRLLGELALSRDLRRDLKALADELADPRAIVGAILAGNRGTGKTTIAHALAASTGRRLVTVASDVPVAAEALTAVLSSRVDEACANAPSLLLIDDERVVRSPILQPVQPDGGVGLRIGMVAAEIDRALGTPGVSVIAIARQPDHIDGCLRQPERLRRAVWISYPDRYARLELLRRHLQAVRLRGVSPLALADELGGCTPADIETVVNDAIRNAHRRDLSAGPRLWPEDVVLTASDIWRAMQLLPGRQAWSLSL